MLCCALRVRKKKLSCLTRFDDGSKPALYLMTPTSAAVKVCRGVFMTGDEAKEMEMEMEKNASKR